MNWTEVTIITTPEAVEAVSGVLYETGVGGVSVEDPTLLLECNRTTKEWDVLDKEVEERYSEDKAVIKAYYAPESNMEENLLRIREGINRAAEFVEVGDVKISSAIVSEEDWENSWKKYYKPVEVGERIIIKPLWEEINTDRDVVIELDPGMAFGTGTHETTRMCLKVLEKYVKENKSLLDVGTGSGILSIGAAKMGCGKITAVDIDTVAVKVAKENISLNGVEEKINVVCGNLTDCIEKEKYGIVVANIIADAIIMLSGGIADFLADDGVYITSGIINHRADDVKATLTDCGFEITEEIREGDWVAIVCRKQV